MSDVGLIILGIVLAVIGFLVERLFAGIISTVGRVLWVVGVVIALIGLVLLIAHLVASELLILPLA